MTELCELAIKYGADKAPQIMHSYTPIYYELFKNKRAIKKVLEIGIGFPELMSFVPNYTIGASLYMWRDFFPEATIYSADIRKDILINEDRIKSFYVDQSDEGSLNHLVEEMGKDFDLIIDDGSHVATHQILTAKILNRCLTKDGIYIIEDVIDVNCVIPFLSDFKTEVVIGDLKINNEKDALIIIRN
jgi:hypothetical protein